MRNPLKYLWAHKWLLAVIAVVVIVVIWILVASSQKPSYQFVTVTRGSITETVAVTGNTSSTTNVSLAFQTGGVIASVYAGLGTHVSAGQTLASLDTSDLRAQLAQTQAAVDAAQAQLDTLTAGPRPENIAVSQTALTSAQQNLSNTYSGIENTLADADAKAVDAVVDQLAPLFNNSQNANPQLTFTISDSQLLNNIQSQWVLTSKELSRWQAELGSATATTPPATLDTILQNAQVHITAVKTLLNETAQALADTTNLSPTLTATYKVDATTALTEANAAATEISTAIQTIAAEKAAVAQAQAQLNLTSASSTPEDIAAQKAQVEQAQANVQSVESKIQQASIVSPINGTVTTQNAKVGQIVSPGVPLVSIIGTNGFEVDAYVPEVDIGKVKTGNPVTMTFDAFPGENFAGSVFYVNSAETVLSGVVDYLVKISFAKPDARIKSGLTANASISTETDANALILPQYAVLQNDQGTFVKILQNGIATQVPVTLGLQDASGNVEIASGVTEGEQVINIGLK
jgi:HlyD family secretion protein